MSSSVASSAARRTHAHSSASRMNCASATAGVEMRVTNVPSCGHDLDQPLVAQAHERLADRGPAHAEPGGELVLGELPAGLAAPR